MTVYATGPCSVNFALVISLFKFGGCRLLLIIFDVERASRIVWSLLKMCMLFIYIYIYIYIYRILIGREIF